MHWRRRIDLVIVRCERIVVLRNKWLLWGHPWDRRTKMRVSILDRVRRVGVHVPRRAGSDPRKVRQLHPLPHS